MGHVLQCCCFFNKPTKIKYALKEKWSHFDLKVETVGTKIRPGFRVIGEYLSQNDSILRVNLN